MRISHWLSCYINSARSQSEAFRTATKTKACYENRVISSLRSRRAPRYVFHPTSKAGLRSLILHVGKLSLEMAPYLTFEHNESTRKASIKVQDRNERKQREMWGAYAPLRTNPKLLTFTGTTRAYLNNYVMGVSEGHTAILRLVGVGYRATVEPSAVTVQPEYPGQHFVSLKVGYSHPIELGIPPGVKASTPQPTRILLEGVDKEVVNQFAAKIRKWRKPEPYKGKGIFVNGETIKLKAKKIK